MIDCSVLKCLASRSVGTAVARRLAMRRVHRELTDSSDRALAEIGIARGDIASVAAGRFGRP